MTEFNPFDAPTERDLMDLHILMGDAAISEALERELAKRQGLTNSVQAVLAVADIVKDKMQLLYPKQFSAATLDGSQWSETFSYRYAHTIMQLWWELLVRDKRT